ncbi:MAG: hypothetical protein R2695_15385 [Acidimicrobiales bacterium]
MAEAAVVRATDDITGQAIVGYVILRGTAEPLEELREEIRARRGHQARSDRSTKAVFLVPDLPKTRSGKIMRRLLRDVADGRDSATPRPWPTWVWSRRSARGGGERRGVSPWPAHWRDGSTASSSARSPSSTWTASSPTRRIVRSSCAASPRLGRVGATAHLDEPLSDGREAIARWSPAHDIVIVTARPVEMRLVTVDWLDRHGVRALISSCFAPPEIAGLRRR